MQDSVKFARFVLYDRTVWVCTRSISLVFVAYVQNKGLETMTG
jgi:hypothetical protein